MISEREPVIVTAIFGANTRLQQYALMASHIFDVRIIFKKNLIIKWIDFMNTCILFKVLQITYHSLYMNGGIDF